jgi:hypothetical protein
MCVQALVLDTHCVGVGETNALISPNDSYKFNCAPLSCLFSTRDVRSLDARIERWLSMISMLTDLIFLVLVPEENMIISQQAVNSMIQHGSRLDPALQALR